ncbi:hypothetical protein F0365_02250 [Nonlabens sp. Ci31]|uniref:hypothetical protein n=1 Tax=Nonlabens sp. Ci31 TaxID=2608253 RepID=UPI001462812F|nr:hypothetical protein [Nonlabens sp. Ci31]QJP33310.1 hypothetical protein F0365_02250 [Nonlabens sp. Ci31]
MKKFILSKTQMSSLFGGDRVINTPGRNRPQESGCSTRVDDGFNDDNNDGVQQCDEKEFKSVTLECPTNC